MFLIFKNFIILNILLCTCAPFPNNNDVSTTSDFERKVEMELSPIKQSLKNIAHSAINKNELNLGIEIGLVQSAVKQIIERAVKAENKNEILLKYQGGLEYNKERITKSALKLYAVPYVRRNFELYESVWYDGGKNSENFNPDDTENTDVESHDLDTRMMSDYKYHAKAWDKILTNSPHPLVEDFKSKIQLLYPKLNLQIVAKNLGLVHTLLNHSNYGAINDDPEIVRLINPDSIIVALKGWGVLKDPVVLDIIKTFERVISGL